MEEKTGSKCRVLLLTESTLDIILEMEGTFPIAGGCSRRVKKTTFEPGGEGNIIIVFNRMGGSAMPTGPLGEDAYGEFLRNAYKEQGVDTSQLKVVEGFKTPVANCIIDEKGEHTFVSTLQGCRFSEFEEVLKLLESCEGLFVSGYHVVDKDSDFFSLTLKLVSAAKQRGIPVFFDPGPLADKIDKNALREILSSTTVISLNQEEAYLLTGNEDIEQAAAELLTEMDGTVVVKSGGRGCYTADKERKRWYSGFKVKAVDTMGAGDSFVGALMYAWLSEFDRDTCFIFANAVGAAKAAKLGTGSKVPTFNEVVAILEQNGYNIPKICKKEGRFVELKLSC